MDTVQNCESYNNIHGFQPTLHEMCDDDSYVSLQLSEDGIARPKAFVMEYV
jgi:hypothetical protein